MAGDFPQRLCDYDRRSDPHMEAGRRSRCPAGGREAVKLPGIEREPVEVEPVEVEPVEAVEVVEAVTRSAVVTVTAQPGPKWCPGFLPYLMYRKVQLFRRSEISEIFLKNPLTSSEISV